MIPFLQYLTIYTSSIIYILTCNHANCFVFHPTFLKSKLTLQLSNNNDDNKQYQGNKGRNWIERSTPTGISPTSISNNNTSTEIIEYTLQLDGDSFDLGLLSQRIYNALVSVASKRFEDGDIPLELLGVYKETAMNLAMKEATKLALEQNNLSLEDNPNEINDENWGTIDTVTISNTAYNSIKEAVETGWEPGETFSFLVRNVIATEKELSIQDLLKTLDPNGKIQKELEKRVDMPDDPAERIFCLRDLKEDNERRCNDVPLEAMGDVVDYDHDIVTKSVVSFDRVCDAWHGKDQKAYATIMQALESNSFLIVSLNESNSNILQSMWNTVHSFFDTIQHKSLPSMDVVPQAGSKKAVVGYASYDNDSMQFLETRLQRMKDENAVQLYPQDLFDNEMKQSLVQAFAVLSKIGKYVTQIAIEASNHESGLSVEKSKMYAKLVTKELLDDGTVSSEQDSTICMSPHRLCRYSYPKNDKSDIKAKEVFGAHTDTSFVTIIPCASVAGLEVFSEDLNQWIRPELIAKQHYLKHNTSNESWHSNYVIILPGELLQLMTRSMILSSIHRVIAVKDAGRSRVSAPILLRARNDKKMNVERYFGSVDDGGDICFLLDDCEDLTMEQIHDALQP